MQQQGPTGGMFAKLCVTAVHELCMTAVHKLCMTAVHKLSVGTFKFG
jgi:hypothetical protein